MNIPAEKDMTGIGVLADSMLLTWQPGMAVIDTADSDLAACNIEDLFYLACAYRLNTIWLCPGSRVSLFLMESPLSFVRPELHDRFKINVKRREEDGVPQNANITPLEGAYGFKPRVYVILPDHDPVWLEDQENARSWAFSDIENPRQFMACNIAFYSQFGTYLSTSPAASGISLMKAKTKPSDWQRDPGELDLPDAMPCQIHWHRRPVGKLAGYHLHRFDKGGAFLAASTGAELGLCMPTYLERTPARATWASSTPPGLWNVQVTPARHFGDLDVHKAEWEGPHWLTTSGVRAMHNLGYDCEIFRAWVWQNDPVKKILQHRRLLSDWAKYLWDGRVILRKKYGKGHPTEKLAKMTANKSLGWLDLSEAFFKKGKDQPKWYHYPHRYHEIQSLAQYRMALKLVDLTKKHPGSVVLVYADAVCLLSQESDPRAAFPELVNREGQLGGFKPDLSLPVTDEVIAAFEQPATSQVLHSLKEIEARSGAYI